jgi:hypothetical protein
MNELRIEIYEKIRYMEDLLISKVDNDILNSNELMVIDKLRE